MKRRTFAAVTATLLALSFVVGVFASVDKRRPVKRVAKARTNSLVSMLPASDAVVTVNGKRFFGEALPKVLSANQKLLGEVLGKLDSMQARTGVDLRRFDSFAAGVNIIKKAGNDFDFDPVVIARGTIDSAAIIESVKRTENIKLREETVAGHTIYLIWAEGSRRNEHTASAGQRRAWWQYRFDQNGLRKCRYYGRTGDDKHYRPHASGPTGRGSEGNIRRSARSWQGIFRRIEGCRQAAVFAAFEQCSHHAGSERDQPRPCDSSK